MINETLRLTAEDRVILGAAWAVLQRVMVGPTEEATQAPRPPVDDKRFMTIAEFCKFRSLSRRHLYDMIAEGLPVHGKGRDRRVDVPGAMKFLANRSGAPT
jgi:predicted DNA-binding transcriptional regulator AlpA